MPDFHYSRAVYLGTCKTFNIFWPGFDAAFDRRGTLYASV
jgi:hypothetical protein